MRKRDAQLVVSWNKRVCCCGVVERTRHTASSQLGQSIHARKCGYIRTVFAERICTWQKHNVHDLASHSNLHDALHACSPSRSKHNRSMQTRAAVLNFTAATLPACLCSTILSCTWRCHPLSSVLASEKHSADTCTRAVLLMQRICTCMQSSGLTGLLKIHVNAYLLLSQTRRQERVTPTAVASLPSAELSWNLFVCWSGLCECVGGSDLVFVCYGSIVCWFVSKSFVCVFTKKYLAVYLYVSLS